MSLTVYEMDYSPYCFPVTQALKALGVSYRSVAISPFTREEVIKVTGGKYYQVPVLKDGAKVVYESSPESQDIAHYIDRKYGKGLLFPKKHDGLQNILIRYIEDDVEDAGFRLVDPYNIARITDIVKRTLLIRHKERKFGKGCVEQWRRDRKLLLEKFDMITGDFEMTFRHSPYLLGEQPVYADFSLFGIFGNYTFKGWNKINPKRKATIAWFERMKKFRYPAA